MLAMKKGIRSINESLTFKLVAAISIIFILGSSLVWFVAIRSQQKQYMADALSFVISYSEVTKRSVRHDMLAGRMDDLQEALVSIGSGNAVEKVRIIGKRNVISYSSDTREKGQRAVWERFSCRNCHDRPLFSQYSPSLMTSRQWTISTVPKGYRVLTLIDPVMNEPDCSTAACHAHSPKQPVLGLLITDFSLLPFDSKVEKQTMRISLFIALFVFLVALFLTMVLWRLVIRPLGKLSVAMDRVSDGDLSHKSDITSHDEIGHLASAFNKMTHELGVARRKMETWAQSLEEEVKKKTQVIKDTQDRLIQAEKLAALGRMTSDIAHQIRNPLTALGGFGRRLMKMGAGEKQKIYAEQIVSEANRLENILKDVLVLSWEPRVELETMPLTLPVEDSLTLYSALCAEHDIVIQKNIDTNIPVLTEEEQVRQAIDNLISNAVDAMPEGGTLSVSITEEELNEILYVALHISDTGMGIAEENMERVFEPFYSTKKVGQGTGLGLAVSRKIITEHGGFIKIVNNPARGITASLYFPYQSEQDRSCTPCWEYKQCGRDKDGSIKCPAFPHFGRACWAVAGTLCSGKIQGTFAQKLADCKKCEFFRSLHESKE